MWFKLTTLHRPDKTGYEMINSFPNEVNKSQPTRLSRWVVANKIIPINRVQVPSKPFKVSVEPLIYFPIIGFVMLNVWATVYV